MIRFALLLAGMLLPTGGWAQFVGVADGELVLDGKPFRYAGTNNYTLMYGGRAQVDSILEGAAAHGWRVVRMWGSLEIGERDGSNSVHGKQNGVYFQYWDGSAPAYNDGDDGLRRLDYAIYRAGELGLRLVIPLVNNWRDFGGMDQYVRWRGGGTHDSFYTDAVIRGWYKDWITHLLTRVNEWNGLAYRNDPTIVAWELANEPRCKGSGVYGTSRECGVATLTEWAGVMAAHVKSVDGNHLVTAGDEGFYCDARSRDWVENCSEGVDTLALAALPAMDAMSFHLYPTSWGKSVAWGKEWIDRHIADARRMGKPAIFGEFGFEDSNTRNVVYKDWTDRVVEGGGGNGMFWMFAGMREGVVSLEGLDLLCPAPICLALANFSRRMDGETELAPVADDRSVTTDSGKAVVLDPLSNSVAYAGAALVAGSVDLDPAVEGQQMSVNSVGGEFVLEADGQVRFTPAADFSGRARALFTVTDTKGAVSNTATITVNVKPAPGAALTLFAFERDAEGWGGDTTEAGTVEAVGGALKVTTNKGGWFGARLNPSVDLSRYKGIRYEVRTEAVATSNNTSIQTGPAFTWCEGPWGNVAAGLTVTAELDFSKLSCGAADLKGVRAVSVYFSGGGTFYLSNVRAE